MMISVDIGDRQSAQRLERQPMLTSTEVYACFTAAAVFIVLLCVLFRVERSSLRYASITLAILIMVPRSSRTRSVALFAIWQRVALRLSVKQEKGRRRADTSSCEWLRRCECLYGLSTAISHNRGRSAGDLRSNGGSTKLRRRPPAGVLLVPSSNCLGSRFLL